MSRPSFSRLSTPNIGEFLPGLERTRRNAGYRDTALLPVPRLICYILTIGGIPICGWEWWGLIDFGEGCWGFVK